MDEYLRPKNDGLPMRASGPWIAEKLDYLARYIDIFETSMRDQPWRERHYIDLFSGPGKCRVNDTETVYLGSPLLALTTSHPFTGYFFVDMDAKCIDTLQRRCSVSPLHDRIRYFHGDSNLVVQRIVQSILSSDREYLPGRRSSLNLAFLDPEGLDLHWETVATLAQPYTMDLIIHYPQGGLNRYMGKAFDTQEQTAVDLFFGGTEWREIYERRAGANIHGFLMDYYKYKLQDLGYKEVFRDDEIGDEPLIRNAKRKAPLYRLLFASKHPLGHKFWREVIRIDVHGQRRLF